MTVFELKRGDMTFTAYITGVTTVVSGDIMAAPAGGGTVDAVSSSGKSSLADGDLQVQTMDTALEQHAVGIALEGAVTTKTIAVSPRGMFIVRTASAVSAGYKLAPIGGPDKAEFTGTAGGTASWIVGKALTGGSAADSYIVALLDFA